ncbi:MAG: RNA polymerase sigma factor [Coriobacteriia bacterium]|nr:RNA polymerase sigma factor [Coriobacteriia bacterium]
MTTTVRPDDSVLVAAAKNGDTAAFEALVRAHSGPVYAHALRFFGQTHAAEDVVQEVFIKVYRSIGSFDGTAAFSTWLYRITRNVCLDMLRSGRRRPVPVDLVNMSFTAPDDPAAEAITTATVEHAMRALAPEDRDALSAIGLFGMSYAEAATALGVPEGTVKSRVFRARKMLSTALGAGGGDR